MEYSQKNEKQIISKIKEGDEAAYKALYTYAYSRLCVYVLNFTKDDAIAQDIVQELFIKLWVNRKKLNVEYSIISYLYKMAHNACIDNYKKNIKRNKVLESFKFESIHELLEDNEKLFQERLGKVEQAIEALPARCKEIFVLSKKENLSYKEIALRLNITVKTVENQIGKALKSIRKKVIDKNYLNLFLNLLYPKQA